MNKKMEGIFVALLTPFDSSENILFDALQKHVEYLIDLGVDGFYVNGSTAESFLMSIKERKKVIEAVSEVNNQRCVVINHCGAIGTGLSLELVSHSNTLDIDAVSALPPFYYGFSEKELIGYYNDLANNSDKNLIIYNMPKFCGVSITPELIREIRRNKKITGLKFTHNDFYALQQIKEADPDLTVYNGYDEMAICGFAAGCDGAIGSTYNVIAPWVKELFILCKKNDYASALGIQSQINDFIREINIENKLFAMLKYLISKIENIDFGICRKPFDVLNREDKMRCDTLIDRLGI